jgi:hypothetical protein
MRSPLVRTIGLAAMVSSIGCSRSCSGSSEAPPAPACKPEFSSIQERILTPACATSGCHTANERAGRLSLAAGTEPFAELVGGKSSICAGKILVVPGAPERSFLYEKITAAPPSCGAHMPIVVDLPADQKECIRAWIASLPPAP